MFNRIEEFFNKIIERNEEDKERQENYLYNKEKLIKINDIVDAYRRQHINPYTAMREITNIIKNF